MTATNTGRLLLLEAVGVASAAVVLATVAYGVVYVVRLVGVLL